MDSAVVKNEYLIGILYGAQTVSDSNTGTTLPSLVQCVLYDLLTGRVQCRCRFVQQQNARIANQSPGVYNALFLTAT